MRDVDFHSLNAEDQKRVIDRLLGIQEHIRSNRNENEAAAATARLTEQLRKFNLDMTELQRRGDRKKLPYGLHLYRFRQKKEIRSKWKHLLLGMLCRYNGASAFTRGDSDWMSIVGEQHTFEAIVAMYEALVKKFTALCDFKQTILSSQQGGWTPSKTIRFKTDWLMGAVTGVERKLEERDEYFRNAAAANTMALVIHREAELQAAIETLVPNRSSNPVRIRLSAAFEDGLATGFRHNFEKEVR